MGGMIQVPFGETSVTRLAPRAGAGAYKTYGMSLPLTSHWKPATCEQVDCAPFREGWSTSVDLGTDLGQRQYHYITHDRTRTHTVARTGNLVTFVFPPGQKCFGADHRMPIEREPVFYVRGGDFRGDPNGGSPIVRNTEDWVDDFANHQDRLSAEIQKG